MSYRTAFQCPVSGQTVIATYAFGKLLIRAVSDDGEEIMPETVSWCKRHNGKRFKTFESADEYIIDVSDGQTMGFEDSRY